jgi:hypothetical protein
MGDYVSKALYLAAQKRNSELRAEVERLERAREQLVGDAEDLKAENGRLIESLHDRCAELDALEADE